MADRMLQFISIVKGHYQINQPYGFGIPLSDVHKKWRAFKKFCPRNNISRNNILKVGISICLALVLVILIIKNQKPTINKEVDVRPNSDPRSATGPGTPIQQEIPGATQPHATSSSAPPQPSLPPPQQSPLATEGLYVDIFLGDEDSNRDKIEGRIVTANLYHEGFEGPQIRAEIDWGEGKGWEAIDPQVDKGRERYQVTHIYENTGEKMVKYRVSDGEGHRKEVQDNIRIED